MRIHPPATIDDGYQDESEMTMKVYQRLARAFQAEGVTATFGHSLHHRPDAHLGHELRRFDPLKRAQPDRRLLPVGANRTKKCDAHTGVAGRAG